MRKGGLWRRSIGALPLLVVGACQEIDVARLNPFASDRPASSADGAAATSRRPRSAPEQLAYSVPYGPVGAAVDTVVPQPPEQAWDGVLDVTRRAGFSIALLDERAGLLVASYEGDAAAYIDCGRIAARSEGGLPRQVEGTAAEAVFSRGYSSSPRAVQRSLGLQARLVVQVDDAGGQSRVRSSASYVVSKRLTVDTGGSRPPDTFVETIRFDSGGKASFVKGTVCQPTGALEKLPLVSAGA